MKPVRTISAGDEFIIEAIRWSEPCWEFDCPTAVLSPVFRTYEDGRSIESAIEDVLIDACLSFDFATTQLPTETNRG